MASKKHNPTTRFIRIILIALVVILFWHGTEGLISIYLFPENPILSDVTSIVIALLIIYFGKLHLNDLD